MTRRSLTETEIAELRDACATRHTPGDLLLYVGLTLLSAGAVWAVATFVLAIVIALLTRLGVPIPTGYAFGGGAVVAVFVWLCFAWHYAKGLRKRNAYHRRLLADLDANVVDEELTTVTSVTRLREEEHLTEFLILQTDDGRFRAVLDDSTSTTENGAPRRSTLRIARHMRVRHFPASGLQMTTFEGKTIKRPRAVISDPRHWPEDEQWLDPDRAARLTAT